MSVSSTQSKRHFVEIVEIEGDRVEKKLGPYVSRRQAEKADAGLNRNLDKDRFYTRVLPSQTETEEEEEASS